MDSVEVLRLAQLLSSNLDVMWTFLLLLTRFMAAIVLLPGVGMGPGGVVVRYPAMVILALTALITSPRATLPPDMVMMGAQIISEALLGAALAMIPHMLISGVQVAAQLSSTSMGLGASQLFDPTTNVTVPDIARLMSDLVVVLFLLLGGHYVIIHAVAGMGGVIVPGTFVVGATTVSELVSRSADIFRIGVMVAAPVLVALLLAQFVLGLISRAVPTVNVFIVSFPLTIGIGLLLLILALPDVVTFMRGEFNRIEPSVIDIVSDARSVTP
jgi:flagellar biosynthetic protein FliR